MSTPVTIDLKVEEPVYLELSVEPPVYVNPSIDPVSEPLFTSSEAARFVNGDKAKLDEITTDIGNMALVFENNLV
jgi:hypothetical protein